jgi:hypothetical protein
MKDNKTKIVIDNFFRKQKKLAKLEKQKRQKRQKKKFKERW